MEKFYFERPTLERKQDALSYINEFYKYDSKINGVARLYEWMDDYEGWLDKIEQDAKVLPSEKSVPTETYFLIRKSDKKIVGMTNIRLALNKRWKTIDGNIGYSIRPTERNKGYSKIILYLALKVCNDNNLKEVLMTADKDNLASWKTMESLGGIFTKEDIDPNSNKIAKFYYIDVNKSLEEYKDLYKPYIKEGIKNERSSIRSR